MKVGGASYTTGALVKALLWGEVGWGDSYMDGSIVVDGDLAEFLDGTNRSRWLPWLPYLPRTSRRVADHYDIPARFYELLLGKSMAYTCGNYLHSNLGLDFAQSHKYLQHENWLELHKGCSVLDCGFGWGGFSRHLLAASRRHALDLKITGISVSPRQHDYALKMGGDIEYMLQDWRQHTHRSYDRFTAIGMLEHVGRKNFPAFFKWVSDRLYDGGVGTLQFVSREEPMSRWLDKWIFPGAEPPSFNEVARHMRKNGLVVVNAMERGGDYVKTLDCWLENFEANISEILALGFNERFIRMFRLYLTACKVSFQNGTSQLMQVQFQKL